MNRSEAISKKALEAYNGTNQKANEEQGNQFTN